MKPIYNAVTGKTEIQFPAKLVAIADEFVENSNKTLYVRTTVEFENKKGEVKKSTAIMYKTNYDKGGIEIGQKYLCTANKDDNGNVYLRLSHLVAVDTPSGDDFDFDATPAEATVAQPKVSLADMGLEGAE